ncbi:hypothetical protein BGW42_003558 [Actinomortierella wolfii]|nr:hypothetical protein BGW41_001707 [Actinomortierella wolfii]KAG0236400.1 hypothetical protein BGW42_003558 [Actinomortierella wolfii]
MLPTAIRRAAHAHQPLIKFLGPRSALNQAHHAATRHPAAPADAEYPLKPAKPQPKTASSATKATVVGGVTRYELDFTELPAKYRHPVLSEAEIEAVEAGGATITF